MFNFFFKNKQIPMQDKPPIYDEIATRSNLDYHVLGILPDPDEVLRKNGTDIRVYQELFIDAHLSSVWEQRVSGVTSYDYDFIPYESNPKLTDFLKDMTADWDWDSLIYEILLARYYGFTVFEKLWVRDGKYLALSKFDSKPREWFAFNNDNKLVIRLKNNLLGREIEPYEFSLIQNRPTYKNPYGQRIASKVFWNVAFKRGGIKFWVKFVEKYGMPFIEAQTDITDSSKKSELLNKLVAMAQDFVAVVPKGTDLKIHPQASNSNSGDNYLKLAEFCDKQISKAVLTQTLTTEQGYVGSQALGNVHLSQFDKITLSDKRFVENAFNKLFKEVLSYNFNDELFPKWELYKENEITKEDIEKDDILSKHITFSKDYYVNKYGLKEEDFEVKSSDKSSGNFNEFEKIDDLSELILNDTDKLNKIMDKTIKPILDLVKESNNYQDLQDRLKNLTNLDTKEIEKLLVKALLIAEHVGINDAE